MPKQVNRLYRQFQPDSYDLKLRIDDKSMTFGGTVIVTGKKVGRPSKRLVLHQRGLKIKSTKVIFHDKKGPQAVVTKRIVHHNSFDEIRLHTDNLLHAGIYTIEVEFSGQITKGMTGIYPCFYKHLNEDKVLIVTQFESHHAREAFPCIDEPEAKATFDLTIETPENKTVLSNMPAKESKILNGEKLTTFQTTPKMSSYLLAFVYGDLNRVEAQTESGVKVSVWATIAQPKNSLEYGLVVAKRSIEFFENYFNVKYPLPKIDHVALPDFSNGAMENWGLITYRERVLVSYPDETSQSLKELIATVIAHETSHQWFGNLVTMRWWDDLWLNESFANLMEYQAVDALFPDWHIWDSFIDHEGLSALRRDSIFGVQPVKTGVKHPEEINSLFDPSIVYAKGGRLLYMLEQFVGEEAFKSGLTDYFNNFAYKNTVGKDLWNALGHSSGKDIDKFMTPWLVQSGFPVVSMSQLGKTVTIHQEHFLDNPAKRDLARIWSIPLFSNGHKVPEVLSKKSVTIQPSNPVGVFLNTGARGHYIVNYETKTQFESLINEVSSSRLASSERLMLLNNISMLARAGYNDYTKVLNLLDAYDKEPDEPVWGMISLILSETKRFTYLDRGLEPKIKNLINELIDYRYQQLGWTEKTGESTGDKKLRARVIGLGAYADNVSVITKSTELFNNYSTNNIDINPELRSVIFGVAVKKEVPGAFDFLIKLHDATSNSDLKSDIATGLTDCRTQLEADILLARLKDPNCTKPQDVTQWLIYLMMNRYVGAAAWDWLVENWDWIKQTFNNDKSYDDYPRYAAGMCNTPEQADKYIEFFEPKRSETALKRNISIALEEIDSRIRWLQRDLPHIKKYFN